MTNIVGVDPGRKGGVVILSPDGSICLSERFDGFDDLAVFNFMRDLPKLIPGGLTVFCEACQPYGINAMTALKVGAQHMAIELACYLEKITCHKVQPRVWSMALHGNINKVMQPKPKNLLLAQKLYPEFVESLGEAPHSGLVDALLIASYGANNITRFLKDEKPK